MHAVVCVHACTENNHVRTGTCRATEVACTCLHGSGSHVGMSTRRVYVLTHFCTHVVVRTSNHHVTLLSVSPIDLHRSHAIGQLADCCIGHGLAMHVSVTKQAS